MAGFVYTQQHREHVGSYHAYGGGPVKNDNAKFAGMKINLPSIFQFKRERRFDSYPYNAEMHASWKECRFLKPAEGLYRLQWQKGMKD